MEIQKYYNTFAQNFIKVISDKHGNPNVLKHVHNILMWKGTET